MPAPLGNNNYKKGRPWSDALNKYISQNPEKMRLAAEALVEKAITGDVQAAKELGDRLDGKATQALEIDANINNINTDDPIENARRIAFILTTGIHAQLSNETAPQIPLNQNDAENLNRGDTLALPSEK